MVEYNFHQTLMVRTPVYSYQFYSAENLSHVLQQPFFQKAIYFASEVFYNELKKSNFELNRLDRKTIETVKKYFNRMCFRPTPFGICSAFGSLRWTDEPTHIEFNPNNLQTHIQFSHKKSIEYAQKLLSVNQHEALWRLNSSIYKAGNEYRFIRSNADSTQLEFIIDSLKTDRFFEKLLAYISHWRTKNELLTFVCAQTGCTIQDAETHMNWLIDAQLITHSLEANITGDDYAERVLKHDHGNQHPTYQVVKKLIEKNIHTNTPHDLKDIPQADDDNTLTSADYYLNLETKLPGATLNSCHQDNIKDGLKCLNILSAIQTPPGLTDFVKNFNQKFDGQTVPLLMALDPEVGVGYGNLAIEEDNINIVKDLVGEGGNEQNTPLVWGSVHALLLKKWNSIPGQNSCISLTDDDLQDIKTNNANLPPGISVMFRIFKNKVLIESAGGNCASALIGRFTPFNNIIHHLACNMADNEAQYNPDVIFAEIAHICHHHTANIDRRAHIYAYEIPVLVQSTAKPEQQILLSDLWVSVIMGEIILQSKKHGKRVVPRLSSAFNYTRNDLAVFRFLCDLQKQSIQTNFSLNLGNLFPGLNFYPRVEYKKTILHLAYWNVQKDVFANALNADKDDKAIIFKAIKLQLGLPQLIALTQHDHQLIFNLDKPNDILFFLETIKSQKQITIKEYLLPDDETIKDESGNTHVNQFIASLYHKQQVYKPLTTSILNTKSHGRKILPGGEWLYLKIHCHPVRSNELLTGCIWNILKKLNHNKLTSEWFFIRYLESGYHIRLRLKICAQKHQDVLNILHQNMCGRVNDGTINNYTIATYERELERYSHQFMDQFEHSFFGSSNFVLAFLKQNAEELTTKHILQFAVASVNDILIILGLNHQLLIGFLENVFNSFANEFSGITDLKYQLDIEFRKQRSVIEDVIKYHDLYYHNLKLNKARTIFIQSLNSLKNVVTINTAWREKWVGDIIHMHLNRLFVSDSRKQEMAVYYFLLKHQRSIQARLLKQQS